MLTCIQLDPDVVRLVPEAKVSPELEISATNHEFHIPLSPTLLLEHSTLCSLVALPYPGSTRRAVAARYAAASDRHDKMFRCDRRWPLLWLDQTIRRKSCSTPQTRSCIINRSRDPKHPFFNLTFHFFWNASVCFLGFRP